MKVGEVWEIELKNNQHLKSIHIAEVGLDRIYYQNCTVKGKLNEKLGESNKGKLAIVLYGRGEQRDHFLSTKIVKQTKIGDNIKLLFDNEFDGYFVWFNQQIKQITISYKDITEYLE